MIDRFPEAWRSLKIRGWRPYVPSGYPSTKVSKKSRFTWRQRAGINANLSKYIVYLKIIGKTA